MKYKETKRKIRKIYNKNFKSTISISRANSNKKYIFSVNYAEHFYIFETEWEEGTSNTIEVELEKFPIDLLPFIKFTPLVKTTDVWVKKMGGNYIDYFNTTQYMNRTNDEEREIYIGEEEIYKIIVNDYKVYLSLSVSASNTNDLNNTKIPIYTKLMITLTNERFLNEIQRNKI
ncbi:MAG: hypothetical protein JW924_03250 [Fusobacteriaceae bacterium]|nr:hypothetical protein [Fusobacteriaceae bacterium]